MVGVFVFGIVLLLVGCALIVFGFRAIISPDLSYSRWVRLDAESGKDVFGEQFVLWLVRGMGVVFMSLGVVIFGLGMLEVFPL